MKHHFTLTFEIAERQSVDVDQVASQITGSDFHIESSPLMGGQFSVHFVREGDHASDLLDLAREQVLRAVPGAELVSMDMSEEPPMLGLVDDVTKIVIKACQVIGDADLAHSWLSQPQPELQGQVPKVLMTNAEGRLLVSRILSQLEAEANQG